MNPRQWKKACKKAAAEIERRWPGEYTFVPADGTDTVYAPPKYEPRRRGPRWMRRSARRFGHPLKGTPLVVSKDYWGEVDIETALSTLKYRDTAENFDWEKAMAIRELTSHKIDQANKALDVLVLDEAAESGASHHYSIRLPMDTANGIPLMSFELIFQNGPIANGINGVTNEALLAIVLDRLEGFQKGPFAQPFNDAAIDHLEQAQQALRLCAEQRQASGQ